MDKLPVGSALRLAHRELIQRLGRSWLHEIRQPISAIRNCSSVMRIDLQGGNTDVESINHSLDMIDAACSRFDEAVRLQADLLDVDIDAVQVGVSMKYVVREVRRLLSSHAKPAGFVLEVEGEGDLAAINQPQALPHLISLLLLESIDFAKSARVRVESRNYPDSVVVKLRLLTEGNRWAMGRLTRNGFGALGVQVVDGATEELELRWHRLPSSNSSVPGPHLDQASKREHT